MRGNRHSIRLRGYDYSQDGFYFVTICTQYRAMMFGRVENGEMVLNDAGEMVKRWYLETQNKFPNIVCREMVVMPNHIHCIWQILSPIPIVGADHRVRPGNDDTGAGTEINVGADHRVHPGNDDTGAGTEINVGADHRVRPGNDDDCTGRGEHVGSPLPGLPLPVVVQWFKTMTTNEYIRGVKQLGWKPFVKRLWQRNYWEHIIRNEHTYEQIANYILSNPKNWKNK